MTLSQDHSLLFAVNAEAELFRPFVVGDKLELRDVESTVRQRAGRRGTIWTVCLCVNFAGNSNVVGFRWTMAN